MAGADREPADPDEAALSAVQDPARAGEGLRWACRRSAIERARGEVSWVKRAVEERLRASGMAFTILRPSYLFRDRLRQLGELEAADTLVWRQVLAAVAEDRFGCLRSGLPPSAADRARERL